MMLVLAAIFCLGSPVGTGQSVTAQSRPAANVQVNRKPIPAQNSQTQPKKADDDLLKSLEDFDPTSWFLGVLWSNKWIALVCLLFIILVFYGIWKVMFSERMAADKEVMGRTADDSELKEWEYQDASGMYLLGENYPIDKYSTKKIRVGVPYTKRAQHIYVEAGTGSLKTNTMLIPQLIDDAKSKIVNSITLDRKGRDQFDKTAKIWKDEGHSVFYLNPWDPSATMGFEPLYNATDDEIRALVEGHIVISPDPRDTTSYYRQQEQLVLTAVFKSLQEAGKCHGPAESPYCRYKTFDEFVETEKTLPVHKRCLCRRQLCTLPAAADIVCRGFYVVRALVQTYPEIFQYCTPLLPGKPSAQTEGMLNGLSTKMSFYSKPGPRETFARSDFWLKHITDPVLINNPKSAILYIDAPAEKGRDATVFASVMSQLIYYRVNMRRQRMKQQGWTEEMVKHLCLRYDEIGTFTIPDINTQLATIRDTNTGCVLLLQDENQFDQFYQKGIRQTILTNSLVKVYTGTIQPERAKIISESLGNKIVSEKSYAFGFEGIFVPSELERKKTMKQAEVPILPPDEIQVMCAREEQGSLWAKKQKRKPNLDGLSIIISEKRPFVVKKTPWFRLETLLSMVNESIKWVSDYIYTIQIQDEKGEPRPRHFYPDNEYGRVTRLNPNPISWDRIKKVYEAIKDVIGDNPESSPMTSKQSGKIKAKARDLYREETEEFQNTFIDKECIRIFEKRFNAISAADANVIMSNFDDLLEIKKREENSRMMEQIDKFTSETNGETN